MLKLVSVHSIGTVRLLSFVFLTDLISYVISNWCLQFCLTLCFYTSILHAVLGCFFFLFLFIGEECFILYVCPYARVVLYMLSEGYICK